MKPHSDGDHHLQQGHAGLPLRSRAHWATTWLRTTSTSVSSREVADVLRLTRTHTVAILTPPGRAPAGMATFVALYGPSL